MTLKKKTTPLKTDDQHEPCREKLAELEAEVKRLKIELAKKHALPPKELEELRVELAELKKAPRVKKGAPERSRPPARSAKDAGGSVPQGSCDHPKSAWENKGWGTICMKCMRKVR